MSNLSEAEIIKYIKDEIENETDTFHWFDDMPNNSTRKQIEESIKAHQGLLDLYNKEKEKNKLLIEGKFREVADKNSYIKDNYVSKDKIREKIKDITEYYEKEVKPEMYHWGDFTAEEHYADVIARFNELLEE